MLTKVIREKFPEGASFTLLKRQATCLGLPPGVLKFITIKELNQVGILDVPDTKL